MLRFICAEMQRGETTGEPLRLTAQGDSTLLSSIGIEQSGRVNDTNHRITRTLNVFLKGMGRYEPRYRPYV